MLLAFLQSFLTSSIPTVSSVTSFIIESQLNNKMTANETLYNYGENASNI